MNGWIGLLAVLAIAVGGSPIEAVFSEFSGLVTDWSVEEKSYRVSIDFTKDVSVMSTVCHPFVKCFERKGNPFEGETSTASPPGGVSNVDPSEGATSTVNPSGGEISTVNPFVLVNTELGTDITGSMGFSPSSPLVSGKLIQISSHIEDDNEKYVIDVTDSIHYVEEYTFLPIIQDEWKFVVRSITIGPHYTVPIPEIFFNPGIDGIVVPMGWKQALLESMNVVSSDDRLILPSDVNFQVTLRLTSSECIVIPVQQLRDPNEQIGCTNCRTLVRFDQSIEQIIIGRQLIHSLHSVVLDNRGERRIGFNRYRTRRVVPLIRAPVLLIPIFSAPDFSTDAHGTLSVVMRRVNSQSEDAIHGFILTSSAAQSLAGRGNYYEFKRVRPIQGEDELYETRLSDFLFAVRSSLRVGAGGGLELKLRIAHPDEAAFSVTVAQSRQFLRIILETAHTSPLTLQDLDLPSPKNPTGPTFEQTECCICMTNIEAGDRVQGLRTCPHRFHWNCVRQWLESGKLSCPLCRAEVCPKK